MKNTLKNFFYKKSNTTIEYISENVNDTINFASNFASFLNIGDIVVLSGELGAGKTVFMSGIAKYFDISNQVSSPTFTIVNEYLAIKDKKQINIYHFDVYRINNGFQFIEQIGTDYFDNGICIIEWGKNIENILPKNTIYIDITKDSVNENIRYFKIYHKKEGF